MKIQNDWKVSRKMEQPLLTRPLIREFTRVGYAT